MSELDPGEMPGPCLFRILNGWTVSGYYIFKGSPPPLSVDAVYEFYFPEHEGQDHEDPERQLRGSIALTNWEIANWLVNMKVDDDFAAQYARALISSGFFGSGADHQETEELRAARQRFKGSKFAHLIDYAICGLGAIDCGVKNLDEGNIFAACQDLMGAEAQWAYVDIGRMIDSSGESVEKSVRRQFASLGGMRAQRKYISSRNELRKRYEAGEFGNKSKNAIAAEVHDSYGVSMLVARRWLNKVSERSPTDRQS